MTLPTGTISFIDFNNELRRPWNQPLSLADFTLRSIIGKQYDLSQISMGELRGKYLYAPYGYVYYADVCEGTSRGRIIADGNGGSLFQVTEYNSTACGYVPPPPPPQHPARGTLLSQYCNGPHLIGTYANGTGGTYDEVIEMYSPSCSSGDNGGG